MSEERRLRRRQEREIKRVALKAARAAGCTCKPEIIVCYGTYAGAPSVNPAVRHDDSCPLVNAGPQFVYGDGSPASERARKAARVQSGARRVQKLAEEAGVTVVATLTPEESELLRSRFVEDTET
jgi:hypothetical protein